MNIIDTVSETIYTKPIRSKVGVKIETQIGVEYSSKPSSLVYYNKNGKICNTNSQQTIDLYA